VESPVIAVDGLVKRYDEVVALGGVGFRIDRGEIVALLGSNGAGKSTLFDILMGFRRPTDGRATVFGFDPFKMPQSAKAKIVFVPEHGAIPFWASANDVARLYRHLYPGFDMAEVQRMLESWDISPRSRLADFSRGERRLAGLAVALGCAPSLLLLDEPFGDLDVVMRLGVMDELRRLHQRERTTIVYTTHILSEVSRMASRVMILRAGEIVIDRIAAELDEPTETLFVKHYGLAPTPAVSGNP
jgi:ABC-2 type transport system ATP-binding protein